VKLAAGRPTAVGAEAIRQMKQKAFGVTLYDVFEVEIDEHQLAGEFGWAKGLYKIVTRPKAGGESFTHIGTFLTVFRKQPDGSWKVYRDTMMPLPK
jgi:ketosteroid isomerase-like protein